MNKFKKIFICTHLFLTTSWLSCMTQTALLEEPAKTYFSTLEEAKKFIQQESDAERERTTRLLKHEEAKNLEEIEKKTPLKSLEELAEESESHSLPPELLGQILLVTQKRQHEKVIKEHQDKARNNIGKRIDYCTHDHTSKQKKFLMKIDRDIFFLANAYGYAKSGLSCYQNIFKKSLCSSDKSEHISDVTLSDTIHMLDIQRGDKLNPIYNHITDNIQLFEEISRLKKERNKLHEKKGKSARQLECLQSILEELERRGYKFYHLPTLKFVKEELVADISGISITDGKAKAASLLDPIKYIAKASPDSSSEIKHDKQPFISTIGNLRVTSRLNFDS